jgi:hypothetical protein
MLIGSSNSFHIKNMVYGHVCILCVWTIVIWDGVCDRGTCYSYERKDVHISGSLAPVRDFFHCFFYQMFF